MVSAGDSFPRGGGAFARGSGGVAGAFTAVVGETAWGNAGAAGGGVTGDATGGVGLVATVGEGAGVGGWINGAEAGFIAIESCRGFVRSFDDPLPSRNTAPTTTSKAAPTPAPPSAAYSTGEGPGLSFSGAAALLAEVRVGLGSGAGAGMGRGRSGGGVVALGVGVGVGAAAGRGAEAGGAVRGGGGGVGRRASAGGGVGAVLAGISLMDWQAGQRTFPPGKVSGSFPGRWQFGQTMLMGTGTPGFKSENLFGVQLETMLVIGVCPCQAGPSKWLGPAGLGATRSGIAVNSGVTGGVPRIVRGVRMSSRGGGGPAGSIAAVDAPETPMMPHAHEDDDPIADAGFLFREETTPRKSSTPAPSGGAPADLGGYDLEGDDPPDDTSPVAPPIPVATPTPRAARRPRVDPELPELPEAPPAARVDQVWSRWAEWWPSLMAQAVVAIVTIYLASVTFAVNDLVTPLIVLFLGLVAFMVVSYPIFITLERPTRMTPEQAARDYFAALSHVRPHYRRMWLLLSSEGRESRDFSTFPEFKAYWKAKVAGLKKGQVGTFTPLSFKVADFKAEKSAGKTILDAKYTVVVTVEGTEPASKLAGAIISGGFVKGPDSQWYLNQGTLPEANAD